MGEPPCRGHRPARSRAGADTQLPRKAAFVQPVLPLANAVDARLSSSGAAATRSGIIESEKGSQMPQIASHRGLPSRTIFARPAGMGDELERIDLWSSFVYVDSHAFIAKAVAFLAPRVAKAAAIPLLLNFRPRRSA